MKAITLTQPWATLVALGAKRIETRSWRTDYQGPLAIHAAKSYPKWARNLCKVEPFKSALAPLGVHFEPADYLGMVVAVCELENVFSVSCLGVDEPERSFGDYSAGRWAWMLARVKPLAVPIPAKGALGLWEWRQEVRQAQPYIHINGDPGPETREALVTALTLLRQQLIDQPSQAQP